ncbi:MAG: hypothetical protein JWM38_665 [Sphingomonas bacterium]|nr:hypothetical protein [Sphingomonas bacterium]
MESGMSEKPEQPDDGYEGDISDKAGDRLGGAKDKPPEVEIGLEEQPGAVTPEP